MTGRTDPPSGDPPPSAAALADGTLVDLRPLARVICTRYAAEYPDEAERYGPAGAEWCTHDNLYLLAWAIGDAESGDVDLDKQVRWLSRVLASRDFPLERLARDLEIAADVIGQELPALNSTAVALRSASATVSDLASSPPKAQ